MRIRPHAVATALLLLVAAAGRVSPSPGHRPGASLHIGGEAMCGAGPVRRGPHGGGGSGSCLLLRLRGGGLGEESLAGGRDDLEVLPDFMQVMAKDDEA